MKYLWMILFVVSCASKTKIVELPGMMANSGLMLEKENIDELIFWTHTDRGPNATEYKKDKDILRPFLQPDFHPYLSQFSVNKKTNDVKILNKLTLDVSGLPNKAGDELPVDMNGKILKRDIKGVDTESICKQGDFFWMGEEYGPSILKIDSNGKVLKRYSPGKGLPSNFSDRKLNRGMEGLTCYKDKIYGILQSPLPDDGLNIRLAEFNPITEKTERVFLYPLDSLSADKIGDLAVDSSGTFFVIEQNSEIGKTSTHKIFSFQLPDSEIIMKKFEIDIVREGFDFADKVEGLVVTDKAFYIVNDNDFGLQNDKFTELKKSWMAIIPR